MIISGLQKLTLLDFPGYVACTIFTRGCNMRCPFCQNAGLVTPDQFDDTAIIPVDDILRFLNERKNRLQGICITGGEPTLQKDLPEFIEHVRAIGYKVKLDTNGTNPQMLQELLQNSMLDYIAMDIKSDFDTYDKLSGCKIDTQSLMRSIDLIKHSDIDYEFRTTVTAEEHSADTFRRIGECIGHVTNYSLQYYEESEHVLNPIFHTPSDSDMQTYAEILKSYADNVIIKGK
jgi:pyruvate formate lyase activating enzyme